MKLLAKTAEDRYQTAAGLAADLRKCLAEWEAHRPHRAVPARRGRRAGPAADPRRSSTAGSARSTRCSRPSTGSWPTGTPELVLVSGYSGIGKSSVVNELHKVLVPPRGLFASGKFDQYKRDIPYATLAQAFQSLVRPLLGRERGGAWPVAGRPERGAGPERSAHRQPRSRAGARDRDTAAGRGLAAAGRARTASRWFSGASSACSRGRSTRSRCSSTICNGWMRRRSTSSSTWSRTPEVRHLLLVGAYRDNEVGPAHPLLRTLEAIREAGARVQEIVLAPLWARRCRPARRRCPALRAGARAAPGATGAGEDRRQSVLRDPVLHGAGRRRAARVRPSRAGLAMGHRSHPRQELHR